MAARVRWRGTTAQRGYHYRHQREREQRLAVYRPGDICSTGGEQLAYWPLSVARRFLDLAHDHVNGGYLPGLSCRRHNRGEGASRGNRMRGTVRQWARARQW